jgi:imidazole glycerol-phosphate synthase subunit HisH
MLVIVDYGSGNPASIVNMLKRCGINAVVSSAPETIAKAERLILPGVGIFDHGMTEIHRRGLFPILNHRVLNDKVPILGICLGLQLLMENSEEGQEKGLGWIPGSVIRFRENRFSKDLKVPHMGWSEVQLKKTSPLFRDMYPDPRFYFVHSFHLEPHNPEDILCTALHGYEFTAGVEKDNIAGVQFHPEKSHKFGMRLLANFATAAERSA